MKKYLLSFILVICACAMVLTGCGSKGLKDNPAADAQIMGNGGFAIQKGDYLYYVNGYVKDYTNELDNYKKDNVEGKVVYGGIYRTKLGVANSLVKDEKGLLKNSERVVSKVVGYENGGFYIVGDYIYYATPYMNVDSNGVIQNERISFNRIKIDGTKNKEMFVTEKGATDIDWRINVVDGKTYLVVVQTVESSRNVVSILDKGKDFSKKVVAESVSEVVFAEGVNLSNDNFYFTRSIKEGEKYTTSGNLVVKASLTKGEEEVFELDKTNTFKLIALNNGRLYLTKTGASKTLLYSYNANENLFNQNNQAEIQLSNDAYTNYYTIDGVPHSIVATDGTNLYKLSNVNGNVVTDLMVAEAVTNVVKVNDGYVYYYNENVVYRINLDNGEKQTVSNVGEQFKDKKFSIDNVKMVDVDERFVYVYTSYTSASGEEHFYLNRINTLSSDMIAEFVGVFEEGHMVAEPTEEESGENEDEEKVETGEVKPWV